MRYVPLIHFGPCNTNIISEFLHLRPGLIDRPPTLPYRVSGWVRVTFPRRAGGYGLLPTAADWADTWQYPKMQNTGAFQPAACLWSHVALLYGNWLPMCWASWHTVLQSSEFLHLDNDSSQPTPPEVSLLASRAVVFEPRTLRSCHPVGNLLLAGQITHLYLHNQKDKIYI